MNEHSIGATTATSTALTYDPPIDKDTKDREKGVLLVEEGKKAEMEQDWTLGRPKEDWEVCQDEIECSR